MIADLQRINLVPMPNERKSGWKNYFDFGEVFGYYFRNKAPGARKNFNLRVMHGINRLSIVMFIAAVIYLLIKHIF